MLIDIFKLILQIILDWKIFQSRGHVQPDDPEQKDFPIITNAQDAAAQRQIDEALRK